MIKVFSFSEAGGHAENEDAFAVGPHPHDSNCYLCVLADGQGGRSGAAVAAKVACRVCIEVASTRLSAALLLAGTWAGILQAADAAVADDPAAGFTTLVAFCVTEAYLCGASSGDSAVFARDVGGSNVILTARQHKNPPVGSGAATAVGFATNLKPPWVVLAMSDGVWKYAGWEHVFNIASEKQGEEIIAALRGRAALRRSGGLQDDFTVVALLNC